MMKWGRITAAVSLVAVGALLALDLAGLIDSWQWLSTAWPAVFILLGAELIVLQFVARARNLKLRFAWGGMLGAAALIALAIGLVHGDRINQAVAAKLDWTGIGALTAERTGEAVELEPVRAAVPAGVAGIVIRHKAGNLVIRQSDGSAELTVRATAWPGGFGGDPREIVRNIRVEIRETEERLEVAADVPSEGRWWWRRMPVVDLEVTVPAGAGQLRRIDAETVAGSVRAGPLHLDTQVKTIDGDVVLAEIRGSVNARTLNGDVSATGVTGNAELKSTNGGVSAADVAGFADLGTTNGDVRAVRVAGRISGTSVNGNVTVEEAGSGVFAKTVNGDVTIAAPALAGGWEAKSTHGVIRLRLPEGADAKIRAKYRFGGLKSDFPLQMEQHDAEGTLGAGTYPVTAETNGNIAIERYRPGAPASMEEDEPDGPGFHVSTH